MSTRPFRKVYTLTDWQTDWLTDWLTCLNFYHSPQCCKASKKLCIENICKGFSFFYDLASLLSKMLCRPWYGIKHKKLHNKSYLHMAFYDIYNMKMNTGLHIHLIHWHLRRKSLPYSWVVYPKAHIPRAN